MARRTTESGRRANDRGAAWRHEAISALLEAAGLPRPAEWPVAAVLDAHPRLRHQYVPMYREEVRVWHAMKTARKLVLRARRDDAPPKPPVVLLRMRGGPGRRVQRVALLELHQWDVMAKALADLGGVAIVQKNVEGIAPRVLRDLREYSELVVGAIPVIRAQPGPRRPAVAALPFDDYAEAVGRLVRANVW